METVVENRNVGLERDRAVEILDAAVELAANLLGTQAQDFAEDARAGTSDTNSPAGEFCALVLCARAPKFALEVPLLLIKGLDVYLRAGLETLLIADRRGDRPATFFQLLDRLVFAVSKRVGDRAQFVHDALARLTVSTEF